MVSTKDNEKEMLFKLDELNNKIDKLIEKNRKLPLLF